MVFPNADYDMSALATSNGSYTFTHKALGAELFRYSWNYGQNWTTWSQWEDVTTIPANVFTGSGLFWTGQHLMVQCLSHA